MAITLQPNSEPTITKSASSSQLVEGQFDHFLWLRGLWVFQLATTVIHIVVERYSYLIVVAIDSAKSSNKIQSMLSSFFHLNMNVCFNNFVGFI